MNTKKLISCLLACTMLAASTAAFAAAPSQYDAQAYGSLGYTSDDPDGEINLAVIANGKVDIVGDAMYIKGSVYSNDTIYVGDGAGNKVDGLFISGVKGMTDYTTGGDLPDQFRAGYIHVTDNHEVDVTNAYSTTLQYEGAIYDDNTSFECAYEPFVVPEIANNLGDVEMNVYNGPISETDWTDWNNPVTTIKENPAGRRVITEDTAFGAVTMNCSQYASWDGTGSVDEAMVIDTTNGDVTVVIDELVNPVNPSITVVGDNDAYIYINNVNTINDLRINYKKEDVSNWESPYVQYGSVEKTHVYLNGGNVVFGASKIAAADMTVNADSLEISGSTVVYADINSGVENFTITGGATEVTGIVCVPNADSEVVDSGTLYGQLHTDTLTINGAGRILWKADTAVAKAEAEPTVEPTAEPTAEPTEAPEFPSGEEVDLKGVGYAYIFGYEPKISYVYDEEAGAGHLAAEVEMAPNDAVTREQVAAMIMRLIDQKYDTKDAQYALTANMAQHEGTWYARGLGYLAGKGAFDGVESVEIGAVTRGEVAKLVVYGLNLSDSVDVDFTDVAGNQYEEYIKIMNAYGYMKGMDNGTFQPDKVMTRAEFCSMFNQIIGRDEMGLTAQDGTEVTPELYSIVDLDEGAWYVDVMMKATSAYDENGLIDVETRLSNIRNVLDNYDSQKFF